jgi:hypothetical protein
MSVIGLSGVSMLSQVAYSQTDYEEYIIMEDIDQQSINQENIGSGSSTNINCGTNTAGTNLAQPITCPSIPGETPTLIPVVTQRVVEVQPAPQPSPGFGGITEAQSPCNPDEVVTGGGYDVSDVALGGEASWGSQSIINTNQDYGLVVEEFAMNNAWHIKVSPVRFLPPDATIQVFAECLKLVPS